MVFDIDNVIVLDYDVCEQCVYWFDVWIQVIKWVFINGIGVEIVVFVDLLNVYGLVVDWVF